jgi:hypothetical protein
LPRCRCRERGLIVVHQHDTRLQLLVTDTFQRLVTDTGRAGFSGFIVQDIAQGIGFQVEPERFVKVPDAPAALFKKEAKVLPEIHDLFIGQFTHTCRQRRHKYLLPVSSVNQVFMLSLPELQPLD